MGHIYCFIMIITNHCLQCPFKISFFQNQNGCIVNKYSHPTNSSTCWMSFSFSIRTTIIHVPLPYPATDSARLTGWWMGPGIGRGTCCLMWFLSSTLPPPLSYKWWVFVRVHRCSFLRYCNPSSSGIFVTNHFWIDSFTVRFCIASINMHLI